MNYDLKPVTRIVGGPDLHINYGSTINLTCIVIHSPVPPPSIIWTHNDKDQNSSSSQLDTPSIHKDNEFNDSPEADRQVPESTTSSGRQVRLPVRFLDEVIGGVDEVNYDSPRGGVSVITEKGDNTTSYLLIQKAKYSDSGSYKCIPSNADPLSVFVHVMNGRPRLRCAEADAEKLKLGRSLHKTKRNGGDVLMRRRPVPGCSACDDDDEQKNLKLCSVEVNCE
ncbi:unnamed protein product [Nezara viridula]|uniref:Ig-like domain-containing protein n=1 Tax=Nezara viridula TaxID=85310 RepID=A0A9P0E815_NEZVI|nr:unnamed protein product [Nezara viridula]